MYFVDTETCGLTGPVVLLQYAKDDDEPTLYHVWLEPIHKTLALIEKIMDEGIIDFNGAFDHFQLTKLYNMFRLCDPSWLPLDHINEIALVESQARFGVCLKPRHCLDLMLHARKGPFQSTMDRKAISVRRVPEVIAGPLARELDERLPLKGIYFAKSKTGQRWHVTKSTKPGFRDVKLVFRPSTKLKDLAAEAFGIPVIHYNEISIGKAYVPNETLYAPFATATVKDTIWLRMQDKEVPIDEILRWEDTFDYGAMPESWCGSWPSVIEYHVAHWMNEGTHQYAKDDITHLQRFMDYFGNPALDDIDSILAHMVGAIRWSGYSIDVPYTRDLYKDYYNRIQGGKRFNAQEYCYQYISEVMSPTEQVVLQVSDVKVSTKKLILEEIKKWRNTDVCGKCNGAGCNACNGEGLIPTSEMHPAAARAYEISEYRQYNYRTTLLKKLLLGRRFHASLDVIGALSGRMAGADDFNPQGVNSADEMRQCFTLKDPTEDLNGGDIDGAEVCVAEAVYGDPDLRADLLQGKKIHAILGTFCFPGKTYDEIKASDHHNDPMQDLYKRSKQGTFALLYGGDAGTLARRVGIEEKAGLLAMENFQKKYKKVGEKRNGIIAKFCSLTQPKGIGTKPIWSEPAEYAETMYGFKRFYTLENQVAKVIFELSAAPPNEWKLFDTKVMRSDREQTAVGATRSALLGAVFGLQAANARSAANHEIQGTSSENNKRIEVALWSLQPVGIAPFVVKPLNVHDETQCPTLKGHTDDTVAILKTLTAELKKIIPLFGLKWKTNLRGWADK